MVCQVDYRADFRAHLEVRAVPVVLAVTRAMRMVHRVVVLDLPGQAAVTIQQDPQAPEAAVTGKMVPVARVAAVPEMARMVNWAGKTLQVQVAAAMAMAGRPAILSPVRVMILPGPVMVGREVLPVVNQASKVLEAMAGRKVTKAGAVARVMTNSQVRSKILMARSCPNGKQ